MRAESEKRFIETEFLKLQNENRQLKKEIERLKAAPLIVGTLRDILTDGRIVVKSSTGPVFLVHASNAIKKPKLTVGARVALNKDSLAVVSSLPPSTDPAIRGAEIIEKPVISYDDIGGLEKQISEVRETVEWPLLKPELFKKVGIDPPVGVLLIGLPGTGKTMLAKAVAHHTNASFIRLVGSELVQKFIGEGARLVRELFELAKEKSPSIIFIDEIDAIGARRLDTATSADREVQRTLMQLLAQLDGFDAMGDIRILAATNRPDILDDALLRPGRFDRIIEIPVPSFEGRVEIFKIHTRKMNVHSGVDMKILAQKSDGMTGADIKAACTESGMFAIREDRNEVVMSDFEKAIRKLHESGPSIEAEISSAMFV